LHYPPEHKAKSERLADFWDFANARDDSLLVNVDDAVLNDFNTQSNHNVPVEKKYLTDVNKYESNLFEGKPQLCNEEDSEEEKALDEEPAEITNQAPWLYKNN